VNEEQVRAAFASMPFAELSQLHDSVVGAMAALKKIDAKMREAAGTESTPTFEPATAQFAKINQVLRAQLASHPEGKGATPGEEAMESPESGGAAISGVVKSRQDVVRALDAVADFFKRTEPSSPIPLLLARAKRLVSKDFLEVLADIAPDAVAQARAAGGLKDGE
jgi:type VI secretion system protein ImpA